MANEEALAKVDKDKQRLVKQPVAKGLTKTGAADSPAPAHADDYQLPACILGAVYKQLAKSKIIPLDAWAVPPYRHGPMSHRLLLGLRLAFPAPYAFAPDTREQAYSIAYWKMIQPLQHHALAWAKETLATQRSELAEFSKQLGARAESVHAASKKLVEFSRDRLWYMEQGLTGFTPRPGETARESSARAEREAFGRRLPYGKEPLLYRLFRHPDAVAMIKAAAKDRDGGMRLIQNAVRRSSDAITEFSSTLDNDRIWRFPPALVGATVRMGIHELPGMPEYAVAIGMVHGRTWWDSALDHAGNAVLALEFVGGPIGAVVGEILDIVLAGLQWMTDFFRAADEDLAALATDFAAKDQRMGKHMSGFEQAASFFGAVGLAAAPYLPGGTKKLKGLLPSRIPGLGGKIPVHISGNGVTVTEELLADAEQQLLKKEKKLVKAETPLVEAEPQLAGKGQQTALKEPQAPKAEAALAETADRLAIARSLASRRAHLYEEKLAEQIKKPGVKIRRARGSAPPAGTANTGGISIIAQRPLVNGGVEVTIHGEVVPGRLVRKGTPGPGQKKAPNFNENSKLLKPSERGRELADYEWGHLFGPGWGDESDILMLTPPDVNTQIQSFGSDKGIEGMVRQIANLAAAKGGVTRITVTGRSFGGLPYDMTHGALVLSEVKYEVVVFMPEGSFAKWEAWIDCKYPGSNQSNDWDSKLLLDIYDQVADR